MSGILAAITEVLKNAVRFEYQYCCEEVITAGHDKRCYGERINAGWILTVDTCYLYIPEAKTPDYACICIQNGAKEMMLRSRGKETGRRGISTINRFYVGEYQRVIASAPNAEIGDTISLCMIGYLMPLWDWREAG